MTLPPDPRATAATSRPVAIGLPPEPAKQRPLRTLIWDVERNPALSWHFKRWQVDIRRFATTIPERVFCYGWSWLGETAIDFDYDMHYDDRRAYVEKLWNLLNEADRIITFNGITADNRWTNNEFLEYGLGPVEYQNIDLFRIAKRRFDLPFKSLDFLAEYVGVARKGHVSEYFTTWQRYLEGDRAAVTEFQQYSMQDILVTREVYNKLEPWV